MSTMGQSFKKELGVGHEGGGHFVEGIPKTSGTTPKARILERHPPLEKGKLK